MVIPEKKSWPLMVQSEGRELCHLNSHTPDLSFILEGTQSFVLLAGHVKILLDVQLRDLAWLCIDFFTLNFFTLNFFISVK